MEMNGMQLVNLRSRRGRAAFFPFETLIETKYENEQKRGESRPETVR
jgi:hypothetical protein